MKSIAVIVMALVYLVSFVMADHQLGADWDDQSSDSSDQTMAMTSGLRGHGAVGIMTNTINARNNNILVSKSKVRLSKSDRVQLAKKIKEMAADSPDSGLAGTMSEQGLLGLLSSLATNPAVLSHAAGIISSVASGNTGALAGHVVGLLGAAAPAVLPAVAPAAASEVPGAAAAAELPALGAAAL